jgi:hypothetical protein
MTEHLPECCALMCECDETHFRSIDCDFSCICPSLRACEQRVLDAAREAVAATFIGWCKDYMNCTDYEHVCGKRREIIAAIDALKEKPDVLQKWRRK